MDAHKYTVAVTLPLTIWVDVFATGEDSAMEVAKALAARTPLDEWVDNRFPLDTTDAETSIINKSY